MIKNGAVRKFMWYELLTGDTKAAAAFYTRLFGWRAQDSGVPGQSYTVLSSGEIGFGGMMAIAENACDAASRPNWTGYIGVDDVDAYTARVEKAGGTVHKEPTDIPGVARFSVVADPWGAAFVLFKGLVNEELKPVPPGTHGSVAWHELHAGDGPAAWNFYSKLFGWTKADAVDMGAMGIYQTFATGGEPVGGIMTKMPEMPVPTWLYYFGVDAVDATIKQAKEAGAQLLMGPHEVPGGRWIAQFLDPQGAMFAVVGNER